MLAYMFTHACMHTYITDSNAVCPIGTTNSSQAMLTPCKNQINFVDTDIYYFVCCQNSDTQG